MKIKRPVWLLPLAGVLAALLLALAGKALLARRRVLPPTGSSLSFSLQPPNPNSSLLTPGPSSWLDTGRRWGLYTEHGELLEGLDEGPPAPAPSVRPSTYSPLPSPHYSPSAPHPSQLTTHPLPEPTIREVQLAAIRYAEVMPEKIRRWRTLAQLRNFIPRFTLGLDRDRNRTIASSTSGGRTTFSVGPEDESLSVDFGFTWDLANLVWDSAQTSIDVRSRLMVQLRQDILEETTRLYFERQRLMAEFTASPTDDPALRRERSLRLEELAAQLDGLTGGLYSEHSD